jgi:aspartyl-tRNA synthetase
MPLNLVRRRMVVSLSVFDRLSSIFAGLDSIRDVIAFPKNNSGRDVMIDSPSTIADMQMNELKIKTTV